MPVSFNSPARNFFLLGSSGEQVVTNFFKTIDQSSGTDGVYIPDEIRYNSSDQKFVLAGSASDSNSKGFGWFEKRDNAGTADWNVRVEATSAGVNTTLSAMELDSSSNLIVVGKTGNVPWIAKYSNGGVIDWQSTTNSGDVEYTGITSDSSGNYYACGSTPTSGESQAFVEKFDASGNPGWGKSAFMLGRDVVLTKIDANNRGEVVAVGYLEDDSRNKGYVIKIDTNTGEVLWDRTIASNRKGSTNDYDDLFCQGVYIDSKNQIYVVGKITTPITEINRGFIIKYTAEGNMIWQKETPVDEDIEYYEVKSDGETEQTIVFGRYYDSTQNDQGGLLSKYSKNGSLVWRRGLFSSYNNFNYFESVSLDADPSFYYLLYTDDTINELSGTPASYTFGKVSSSGNGLGDFEYDEGAGETVYYEIINIQDNIGRLSDGSVRQDTSDLITYPYNATHLLFDDLATQVANKKRQMDSPDSFEYSGSPAIRPADFQELNLLGDVYSGSGDWLDQSGKGNNGTLIGYTGDQPYDNFGSVIFDGTGDWIDYTLASTVGNQFTMEAWFFAIQSRPYATIFEFGNHSTGNGILLQTRKTGPDADYDGVFCRCSTTDITNATISNPYPIDLFAWNHIALTFDFGTAELYLNGTSIGTANWSFSSYSATNFRIGASVYGSGSESFPGFISNLRVVDSVVYSSNFTVPSTPLTNITNTKLLTCQGSTIADASSNTLTPTINGDVVVSGDEGPTHNAAGYWEFDGVGDYITIDPTDINSTIGDSITIECWVNTDNSAKYQVIGGGQDTTGTRYTALFNINSTGGQGYGFDLEASSGQVRLTSTNGSVVNGSWDHLVGTYNGSTANFYLNGSLVDTDTGTSGNVNTFDYVSFGRDFGDNTRYFDGKLGEVRIYPRALTAAQVFQNYNATKSKYINEAPDIAPKIGPGIIYDSNLLLNYDFGNRATYDRAENLIPKSDFTTPTWATNGLVYTTFDVIPSPYGGTLDAAEMIASSANAFDAAIVGLNLELSTTYTVSAYVKQGTATINRIGLWSGTQWTDYIDVEWINGEPTLFGSQSSNPNYSFVNSGGGWWRFIIVVTTLSNDTTYNWHFHPDRSGTGLTAYIWGPQIEKGSTAGRYIKTSGTAITAPTTVKNLSSTSYTGTITGATFNPAGYFETTDSAWVSSGYGATGTSDMTIEQWVRADSFPVTFHATFYSQSSNVGGFYGVGYGTVNGWFFGDYNGSVRNVASSGTTASVNTWYHFVARRSGGNLTVHINGVDVTSTSASTSISFTAADPRIGNNPAAPNGEYWDGDIAETRIYNRALSSTEISQNFNATRSKYGV